MTELRALNKMKENNNSRYYTRSGREVIQRKMYRPGDTGMEGGKKKRKTIKKHKKSKKKNKRSIRK